MARARRRSDDVLEALGPAREQENREFARQVAKSRGIPSDELAAGNRRPRDYTAADEAQDFGDPAPGAALGRRGEPSAGALLTSAPVGARSPKPVQEAASAVPGGGLVTSVSSHTGGTVSGLILGPSPMHWSSRSWDYGAEGPLLWFKAKFLNEAANGPKSSTPTTTPTTTPTKPRCSELWATSPALSSSASPACGSSFRQQRAPSPRCWG